LKYLQNGCKVYPGKEKKTTKFLVIAAGKKQGRLKSINLHDEKYKACH